MRSRLVFDANYNVQEPVLVLCKQSGNKICRLPAADITFKDSMQNDSELSCTVSKYNNGELFAHWDDIKDFRLIWVKEWNTWLSMEVKTEEDDGTVKAITAANAGKVELSNILLFDVEINTEDDIARDDYEPTVVYNPDKKNASLLHRIFEKAPHYKILYVDDSLKNIQRTFSFDDKSIYDALDTIAEEIHCYVEISLETNSSGTIDRNISLYDLESYCPKCGHREDYFSVCPKCGNTDIKQGYGEDTTIFISADNVASDLTYSSDTGSVKNCFRLEGGDDLMTAVIRSCNPNGSSYIYYFSEDDKADMSPALVKALDDYDALYQKYQNEYAYKPDAKITSQYNTLVEKYRTDSNGYKTIPATITGFPELMNYYYDTIDFELYLRHSMMPSPKPADTTAQEQVTTLPSTPLSPVAVSSLKKVSETTISSMVLDRAKLFIDPRYQTRIGSSSYDDSTHTWTGTFIVTNYSNEEDTATSNNISISISDDNETYIKQRLDSVLSRQIADSNDIVSLFKQTTAEFTQTIKKYGLTSLKDFYDCCNACIDLLIQQGIADESNSLYKDLYVPYHEKLTALESEIKTRESEIAIVAGTKSTDGSVVVDGMETILETERLNIQNALNFKKNLGDDLWNELYIYRREDKYTNTNYISDGLDNAQLVANALEFIKTATKEIYRSATLQHSITATLSNLLTIPEFAPIVDKFQVGNWMRARVDNKINRLRLIDYEIRFSSIKQLDVTFSDVEKIVGGYSDLQSVINKSSAMATSYDSVSRQAGHGQQSSNKLDTWVNDGLALTNMKIVNDSQNQNLQITDSGMLLREYDPMTDTYADKQVKIINHGLYYTNDGWKTSKAGIGTFYYTDPKTNEIVEAYGLIADTVTGNIILSKDVGIYNSNNSIQLDSDGFTLTANKEPGKTPDKIFKIQRKDIDANGKETTTPLLYLDDEGELVLNGSVKIGSSDKNSSLGDITDKIDNIQNSKMYRVETVVVGSTIFNTRDQTAQIECHVYSWDTDITDTLDASGFNWHRYSSDTDSDTDWDSHHQGMKTITISTEDVYQNASFSCDVTI